MPGNDRHDEAHNTSGSPGRGNLNSVNMKKTLNVIKNEKFDEVIEMSDSEDSNSSLDSVLLMDKDVGSCDGDGKDIKANSNLLENNPYDETYDISSGDEGATSSISTPPESDVEEKYKGSNIRREEAVPLPIRERCVDNNGCSEPDSIEELNLREGRSTTPQKVKGAYNPATYAHLNVLSEVKGLFEYINGYKPQRVELESTLKCFIPGYIPAIGDVDPFVKIPRPDGKPDQLGFQFIDEPSAYQSDPNVLELYLRSLSRKQNAELAVRSIENAQKRPEEIERWILSIDQLHRSNPPLQVYHNELMPDFESLMDVWPEEVENILNNIPVRE